MSRYVDLSERVTAQYYNAEYEEWTQETTTIAEILDSVCDDYTVLPSTQPQHIKGRWKRTKANSGYNAEWVCSNCGYTVYAEFCNYNYCSSCGSDMRGEQDE